jgi:hypothetical protein
MGIYYKTIVCVGFYKKNDNVTIELPENIKTTFDKEGTLCYIEYTYIDPKTFDRILDANDLDRGYVLLEEAKNILKFDDNVQDDDINNLKKLEEQINPEYKIGSYLIEYCICTLESPPSTSARIWSIK